MQLKQDNNEHNLAALPLQALWFRTLPCNPSGFAHLPAIPRKPLLAIARTEPLAIFFLYITYVVSYHNI